MLDASLLQRLLALSQKTGDRLIIAHEQGATVLLSLEQYEALVLGGVSVAPFSPSPIAPVGKQVFAPPVDPIEKVNLEMAKAVAKKPQEAAERLAAELAPAAPLETVGEETFYLEPIDEL